MPRTRLLISVRSAAEALAALDAGADLIDVKEPSRGSLGMADSSVIESIIAAVAGRRPVSAALGELVELVDQPPAAALPPGLRYAKLGLAGAAARPWRKQLAEAFAAIPHIAPIAVAYIGEDASTPAPTDVLQWAIDHRAAGVLLDTHQKPRGDLLRFCEAPWLRSFIGRARAAGLLVALAGSLRGESLAIALALSPDIIAVRGAACVHGDRVNPIDPPRVRDLAAVIAVHNAPPHQTPPARTIHAAG